jgi:hypothetical protein
MFNLSRLFIGRRLSELLKNIEGNLKMKAGNLQWFYIAVDERIDMNNTLNLPFFRLWN